MTDVLVLTGPRILKTRHVLLIYSEGGRVLAFLNPFNEMLDVCKMVNSALDPKLDNFTKLSA